MSGTVHSLPTAGAGTTAASVAGFIGLTQGSLLLLSFTCLVMGLHVFYMGRLEVNARRLRRKGRID